MTTFELVGWIVLYLTVGFLVALLFAMNEKMVVRVKHLPFNCIRIVFWPIQLYFIIIDFYAEKVVIDFREVK